jgi:hypothetical protein
MLRFLIVVKYHCLFFNAIASFLLQLMIRLKTLHWCRRCVEKKNTFKFETVNKGGDSEGKQNPQKDVFSSCFTKEKKERKCSEAG